MVFKLIRASFPKFYNVVLTGRLMNRLSKDIYNLDYEIPDSLFNLYNIFSITFASLFNFILVVYIQFHFYWDTFIILAIIIFSFFFGRLYLRSIREIVRIDAIAKSPILSFFSEIIRGITYVRNCVAKSQVF
jgi:ABC-type multidrug transport system fused ATPase/permease subunit